MFNVFLQLTTAQQIILTLMTIVTILLGLYAMNWSLLTYLSIKGRNKTLEPPQIKELPEVTIHIPLFNERNVAERIIESCMKIDYPKDKMKIIVIDDSTDETTKIVESFENKFPHLIKMIHRDDRTGFKAGALQTALDMTHSDFVMIFDADFVPRKDILRKLVPYMYLDEKIAFVQTRSSYLNKYQTWVTRSTALAIDGYGIIDLRGRYSANLLAHFSGTGGLFRCSAIRSVGGWSSETLAEDLDLSIQMQLKGWKYIFLPKITCPGEIPATFKLLRKQQARWAKGFAQCFKKHYRSIIKSPLLSIFQKFEALMLLATYFVAPVSVLSLILMPFYFSIFPISFFFHDYWLTILGPIASIFLTIIYISPLLLYGTTIFELSEKHIDYNEIPRIVGIAALGAGTLLATSKATLEGFLNINSQFEATPKYGTIDG
ncbi:glycosyltransferase [Candidatus Bathyarchaeota archaeon]|jgi:cellulose synthase/poly-beta-1,6-N-acetylglucosamine synthase-like glycosyltransferase|nr:glycosyltransferase [Candidatus Bathyarchaeota archaeon]